MLNPLLSMLSQLYQLFLQKIQPLYSFRKWVVLVLLLALCASCSSPEAPDVDLKLSVQPAGRPGLYSVTGTTNLPDQSQIAVSAIRYLRPSGEEFIGPDPKATYSILDRRIVEVQQGKWEATLNLWQVAPDGRFREVWQLNQPETGLSLDPATEVSFTAIFDPAGQRRTAQQQNIPTQDLQGTLVRFNNDGQPYVQASQTLQIPRPVGRRPPPVVKEEDINYGWGNRYQLKPQPPAANTIRTEPIKTEQTDAPLSPSEFMR